VENSHPGLLQSLREKKSLTDEITTDLKQALSDFKDIWTERRSASLAESTSGGKSETAQPVGAGA
jgi:hypothetical protein